jgi:hypothetical protein
MEKKIFLFRSGAPCPPKYGPALRGGGGSYLPCPMVATALIGVRQERHWSKGWLRLSGKATLPPVPGPHLAYICGYLRHILLTPELM